MTLLLALLYPLAIQYERGGWWNLCLLLAIPAAIIDVIANYTELALLTWDFPKKGEYTFSTRLVRLQEGTAWQRFIASVVIPYLNYFDPNHVPVKAG